MQADTGIRELLFHPHKGRWRGEGKREWIQLGPDCETSKPSPEMRLLQQGSAPQGSGTLQLAPPMGTTQWNMRLGDISHSSLHTACTNKINNSSKKKILPNQISIFSFEHQSKWFIMKGLTPWLGWTQDFLEENWLLGNLTHRLSLRL